MFKLEKLDKKRHDRNGFCCKNLLFEVYLKRFAKQDESKNTTRVFVAVKIDDPEPKKIYGYVTINTYAVTSIDDFNPNLPHASYGYLPAILIGRLAIDRNQKQLRGHELLGQILIKCKNLSEEVGVSIIVVEPIDSEAYTFYKRQGFIPVSVESKYLFYPVASIEI